MPKTIASRVSLLARSFSPDEAKGLSFEEFVLQGGLYEKLPDAPNVDGVVALYDASLSYLLNGVRNAVFAAELPAIGYLPNVQNFLIGHFSTLLGNYGLLVEMVQDSTSHQAASLPIRNFDADEFRTLVGVCQARSLERTFQNEIIPALNRLLRLRGPKRRSSYPHVYFKDESGRYFRYGHERHSKYETGGSHGQACLMNGRYRFGGVLEQDRHFNVTVGDSDARELISCNLPNCHDDVINVKDRTHINMFSNDFHK
jgi:hypothetical protein